MNILEASRNGSSGLGVWFQGPWQLMIDSMTRERERESGRQRVETVRTIFNNLYVNVFLLECNSVWSVFNVCHLFFMWSGNRECVLILFNLSIMMTLVCLYPQFVVEFPLVYTENMQSADWDCSLWLWRLIALSHQSFTTVSEQNAPKGLLTAQQFPFIQ